jgi:hypothetical protein
MQNRPGSSKEEVSGAGKNSKGHSSVLASLREAAIDRSMGAHAMDARTASIPRRGAGEDISMVGKGKMGPLCTKCESSIWERDFMAKRVRQMRTGWAHKICPKRPRKPKQGRIAKPKEQNTSLRVDWDEILRRQKAGTIVDEDSRIYLDGREVLRGADYKARVQEVLARDGGKCQRVVALESIDLNPPIVTKIRCGRPAGKHPHHIIKRSKGRDDRAPNLSSRCDECNLSQADHPEHKTQFGAARRAPYAEEQ